MPQPITFAEWSYLGKGRYHRRDFRFDTLTHMSAFGAEDTLFADLGKHEIFTPTRDYGTLSVTELAGGPDMTEQVALRLHNRNPDVLTCIANLSNDEVFTPPEFANQMLDLLARRGPRHDGANIWADPPSGSSTRYQVRRLPPRDHLAAHRGLEDEIPDLEARVDHILTKQVFGIGITYLTSLLARRSVYCSKWANGKHSIAKSFATDAGNIWFERKEHTWSGATEFVETADVNGRPIRKWTNGRCTYCGANQRDYDRGAELETHAYAFIHTDDLKARIEELFGDEMQFDVIIGNPPYQLGQSGGDGRRQLRDADLPEVRGRAQAWTRVTSWWSPRHAGLPAVEDSMSSGSEMLGDRASA